MRRSTLLQFTASLLLGSLLCYVAMRDWKWGDILDILKPLPRTGVQLLLPAAGLPPPGTLLRLEREGRPVVALPLPADGTRVVSFPAPPGRMTGAWQVLLPDGRDLQGWALDFRDPAERLAKGRPAIVPAPEPSAGAVARGTAVEQRGEGLRRAPGSFATDPLVFPAHPAAQGNIVAPVREIDWLWLVPYVGLFLVIHVLRILRWGVLLRPLDRVGTWRLLLVGSVGFMAILLFPLRLGEFVRPYLVSRETRIPMTSALATCVVERIIDALAVVFILFLVVALLPRDLAPPGVLQAGYLTLFIFLGALAVLLAAHRKRELTLGLLQATLGRVAPGLARRIAGLLGTFIDGLKALPTPGSLVLFLGQTTLYWLLIGLGYWVLFRAVGITLPDGNWPGLVVAFAVMAILAIGIILPGGPAFAGSFEVALSLGLGLFITSEMLATRGAAYILLMHTLQFVLQVVVGLASLSSGGFSLRRMVQDSQTAARSGGAAPQPLRATPPAGACPVQPETKPG